METSALRHVRWTTHALLALTLTGVLHAGWRLRDSLRDNGEVEARVAAELERVGKERPPEAVARSLAGLRREEAEGALRAWERRRTGLEETLGLTTDAGLKAWAEDVHGALRLNATLSDPSELLETLTDKASELGELAQRRHWRNLAFLSARLGQRLKNLQASGRLESPLARYAVSDLEAMERLVRSSTLDDGDRHGVLRRLESIRQELDMLTDLHGARQGALKLGKDGGAALDRWLASARLAAGSLGALRERRRERALQEVWMVAALIALAWAALAGLWAHARRAQRRHQDHALLEALRAGLAGQDDKWRPYVGAARVDEVERTLRAARKRMALGNDLQGGLPFGVLLVDGRGRVVWANQIFCEQFQLDPAAVLEEDHGWAAVLARLSLNAGDPVGDALATMEAGTWQVRAEVERGVSIPFEMHVSPLEDQGERKVLVVFYPLALMRDAITAQAQLVAQPVREAMAALESGRWDARAMAEIAPMWREAGLGEDWQRLCSVLQRLDGERRELLAQVGTREDRLHDQDLTVRRLEDGIERAMAAQRSCLHGLKEVRDGLLSADQLSSELAAAFGALAEDARGGAKRGELVQETARVLSERLLAAKEAVAAFERGKLEWKGDKLAVAEAKLALVRAHNGFLRASGDLTPEAERAAADFKGHLLRLDDAVARLDARLAHLDVQTTKIAMSCAGPAPEAPEVRVDFSGHERSAREIMAALREDQDHLVNVLKRLAGELQFSQREAATLLEAPTMADGDELPPMA